MYLIKLFAASSQSIFSSTGSISNLSVSATGSIANLFVSGDTLLNTIATTQSALAATDLVIAYKIPIVVNGVTYYIYVVGGRYEDEEWVPYSGQVIGEHFPVALGINSMEFVRAIPGLPRNSNLLSQQFEVTI